MLGEELLSVHAEVTFDESIENVETHIHLPYGSSNYGNADEIRIAIMNQDLAILPSASSLRVVGRLTKANGTDPLDSTDFINFGVCHLFESISYELNGVQIDHCKNVGVTATLKAFASASPSQKHALENAGFYLPSETIKNADGYFDVNIPLKMLLGFAEDYPKILLHCKHEIVLLRSNSDNNAVITISNDLAPVAERFRVNLSSVQWLVPYIRLSDRKKVALYKTLTEDRPIPLAFRSWDLFTYPTLPTTSKLVWPIKTSNFLEKPRFVIIAFQTGRQNNSLKDSSEFDSCSIRDVKLFLNSQSYPYNQLHLDFGRNQFSNLYDMYCRFQRSYYGRESEPFLSKSDFSTHCIIVLDCSRQNEALKSSTVDIRLEIEAHDNFPANTSCFALILNDKIVDYSPLSGIVTKRI